MTGEPTLVDLDAPLPSGGTHLIEASAGTGKTWTLSTLVVRYVAMTEMAIGRMLLVTFTNDAAADLRGRVRQRLHEMLRLLDPESVNATDDPLAAALLQSPGRQQATARIATALADFDQATITTIHSFSQQLLTRAGLEHNPTLRLRSDVTTVATDLVIDNLAHSALVNDVDGGGDQHVHIPEAERVVAGLNLARNHPDALILPDWSEAMDRLAGFVKMRELVESGNEASAKELWQGKGGPTAKKLAGIIPSLEKNAAIARQVRQSRDALAAALRDRDEVGFADLLTEARTLVRTSESVVADVGSRFDLVLVDEFQDTDPVQWEILSTLFAGSGQAPTTMALVGDPKQAIYRFRGGDIATYQRARSQTTTAPATLRRNFRSQQRLVDGLNHLFTGATFGPGTSYVPIEADKAAIDTGGAPLRVRIGPASLAADPLRELIAADLVREVQAARRSDPSLSYSDIAVLYGAHAHAPPIQWELTKAGIPAVITKGDTVLSSPSVGHWRKLLWAMDRPTDASRARTAALTPVLGFAPEDVLDEAMVTALQHELATWEGLLVSRGMAFAARTIMRSHGVAARLMRRTSGERDLVDFEHLAELVHLASNGAGLSPAAAIEILDELLLADPDEENIDLAADVTKRRLDTETDENVVRLMSVHASKGLEFKMVLCPTLWSTPVNRPPWMYEGPTSQPVVHFSTKEVDPTPADQAKAESLDESRRLAYVALTRAAQRLVLWWPDVASKGVSTSADKSGLAAVLREAAADRGLEPGPTADTLRGLAQLAPDLLAVETFDDGTLGSAESEPDEVEEPVALAVATLTASPDRSQGRLSFTGLTSVAFPWEDDYGQATSDPELGEDQGSADENPDEILDALDPVPDAEVDLAALPVGKDAGTRLHSLYEHLDFAAAPTERDEHIAEFTQAWLPDEPERLARLNRGLAQTLIAPLGPSVDNMALADISQADRLDEMQFDLPLRKGAESSATLPQLSELLLDHLPAVTGVDHQVREWAESLASPRRVVRIGGYLTGSIDLLLRHQGADGDTRYVVADYKSNKIARWPEPMTEDVYVQDRLGNEMVHGQYLLQALLYLVATNRFLSLRLDGYDADRHLGPALYLFVRGMTGAVASDGAPNGVFSWRPTSTLLTAVDELLLEPRP